MPLLPNFTWASSIGRWTTCAFAVFQFPEADCRFLPWSASCPSFQFWREPNSGHRPVPCLLWLEKLWQFPCGIVEAFRGKNCRCSEIERKRVLDLFWDIGSRGWLTSVDDADKWLTVAGDRIEMLLEAFPQPRIPTRSCGGLHVQPEMSSKERSTLWWWWLSMFEEQSKLRSNCGRRDVMCEMKKKLPGFVSALWIWEVLRLWLWYYSFAARHPKVGKKNSPAGNLKSLKVKL